MTPYNREIAGLLNVREALRRRASEGDTPPVFEFTPELKEAISSSTRRLNAAATNADKLLRDVCEWLAENGPKIRVEGGQCADVAESDEDGGTTYTLTYDRVGKGWCLAADVWEYRYAHDDDGARVSDGYGDHERETLKERKQAVLSLPRELKVEAVTVLDGLLKAIAQRAGEPAARVEASVTPAAAVTSKPPKHSDDLREFQKGTIEALLDAEKKEKASAKSAPPVDLLAVFRKS